MPNDDDTQDDDEDHSDEELKEIYPGQSVADLGARPDGGPDLGMGIGCLGLSVLLLVAPLWYFFSPNAAVIALIVTALLSLSAAVSEGAKTQKRWDRVAAARKEEEALRAARATLRAIYTKRWDAEIAQRVLARQIWQGQTAAMLSAALGDPEAVDERVLKSKTSETWKYHQYAKGKFKLKIKLDDGVVVGWEDTR